MSTNLQALLAQRAELDKQIAAEKNQHKVAGIAKIQEILNEYGMTVADLMGRGAGTKPKKPSGKVAPKFRNPITGQAWSGRGLQPRWMKAALAEGKSMSDFAITPA